MANENWVMAKKVVSPILISTVIITGYALLVKIFAMKGK
ncbi:hypothetical protein ES704_02058 [subsurface metagenome]